MVHRQSQSNRNFQRQRVSLRCPGTSPIREDSRSRTISECGSVETFQNEICRRRSCICDTWEFYDLRISPIQPSQSLLGLGLVWCIQRFEILFNLFRMRICTPLGRGLLVSRVAISRVTSTTPFSTLAFTQCSRPPPLCRSTLVPQKPLSLMKINPPKNARNVSSVPSTAEQYDGLPSSIFSAFCIF